MDIKSMKDKKRVGIFLLPQHGHSVPLLRMAQFLTYHADQLDIVVHGSTMLKPTIEKNFKQMKVVYIDDGITSSTFEQATIPPFMKTIPAIWEPYFANLKPDFDIILTDMFNVAANKFAIKHGIKLIVNHPSNLTHYASCNNFLCLENSIGVGGFTITHPPILPSFFWKFFGLYQNFQSYYKNSFMLINSCFGFDDPQPLPPNIRMIGMLESSEKKPLKDEKLKEWMERKKMEKKNEFIYAAFGSAVKISPNLAHRIYEGFAKTGYPVIWAFKSSQPLEIDDDNIYISNWLPQTEILSLEEVKVFVTHGGWNSTSEGICHGKPLAVLPFFADQPTNAKIIQKNKLGITLHPRKKPVRQPQFNLPDLQSENITRKLSQIFADYESYKNNVDRVKRINEGLSGFQILKDTVEEVLEFGYDHLIDPYSVKLWERGTHQTLKLLAILVLVFILVLTLIMFI